MKFHGIDAQGTLYDQRVSALPTWTLNDIGRIVFLTTNDTVYIASSTGWVPLSNVDALTAGAGISITKTSTPAQSITIALADSFLASGRKIWIYEDTAPTGWSIVSGCGDGLLAVKGGTSDYNAAGGTRQGTWTQLSHTHAISVTGVSSAHTHTISTHTHGFSFTLPTHTHNLVVPSTGWGIYGYNPQGSLAVTASGYYGYSTGGDRTLSTSSQTSDVGNGTTNGSGTLTSNADGAHTHTATSDTATPSPYWRPLANIGIIVQKT